MLFDAVDSSESPQTATSVVPWRSVLLDAEGGGQWVVAGDADGDGQVEIISAQNVNQDDILYTSAVAAQRLDGTVLWRWGTPNLGRRTWHHDVACQTHDGDGDGCNEVVVCAHGALVELEGATGAKPVDFQLVLTCCGANAMAMLNGEGRVLWEATGEHFESVDVGRVLPDWDGDGLDEIIVGESCGVYGYPGQRFLTFQLPQEGFALEGPHERALVPANVAGNGRSDLIVTSPHAAHVFVNEKGLPDERFGEPGSECNSTLY